jgi:tetratricopeptide (TPR) repeat protein
MKNDMKTILWSGLMSLALLLGSVISVHAQCGADYLWPTDGAQKAKAEESFVRLKDSKTNGNFKESVPNLLWLINNVPQLNKTLYIYGADVYDGLAKKETDAAKKMKYADSLAIIYDLRLKHTPCNEEASIANRKALAVYPYYINGDKVKDLFQLMEKALEANGNNIMDGTIIPYMQAACISKTKFKNLSDDEIIERYDKISEVIKAKIKKAQSEGKPVDKYTKYQADIDNIFANCGVVIDCGLVKKTLEPKYRANPNDADLAKKIFYYMLQGKCTDDPLWLETGEKVFETSPEFGIGKNLAIRYVAQDNFSKAETFLKKSLPLATSNEDKAETLILLGTIRAKQGGKVEARDLFRQALGTSAGNKEAYEKIGDLYMNSTKDCAREKSYAEDRLVFLAAYEMYAKAGNQQKMSQAKAQFPSNTELFEVGWKEGEVKKLDYCWVGEAVTLRSRGKD